MNKQNKDSFIIVRVKYTEKESLKKLAKKAKQKFSSFIRFTLGLK